MNVNTNNMEACAYRAKLTTKANFTNECNTVGNRKLQETEDKKQTITCSKYMQEAGETRRKQQILQGEEKKKKAKSFHQLCKACVSAEAC
jgi:hypothetical protein